MNWTRQGRIFECDHTSFEWSKTHSALPTPFVLNETTVRIFYTTRDATQQSRISFIDVDRDNPLQIKYIHDRPILSLGALGTFDDKGHTTSQVLKVSDQLYRLFINGYNIGNPSRYRVGIGIADSPDLTRFDKPFEGPLIDRSIYSPCGAATPFILREGKLYRMWYTSFLRWEVLNEIPEPYYCIKYAESDDLFNWRFEDEPVISLLGNEGGIVRPTVVKILEGYQMFFSVRKNTDYRLGSSNSYRIGSARSIDGRRWQRNDSEFDVGLADAGWDSEMMAYPYVIAIDDKLHMFYNGNGFGQSGFGLLTAKIV
jgi:hypothetical protein